MNWDHKKITAKVIEAAEKFGSKNPQQRKQLKFWLCKCDNDEVFKGLYNIFLSDEGNNFERQQLAGKLLLIVKPQCNFELKKIIKASLRTYNLSVEEYPWYFVVIFGKDHILKIINEIENEELTDVEENGLKTFKWWVEGYNQQSLANILL